MYNKYVKCVFLFIYIRKTWMNHIQFQYLGIHTKAIIVHSEVDFACF